MPIEDDKLYEELGRVWQHFANWRERIFAGYLTAIAALGYVFSKGVGNPHVGAALFAFVIVLSIVFRILDYRTTDLINLCQDTSEKMAGSRGFHGELNKARFTTSGRPSYGIAVDILVVGVAGASATGFFICFAKWWNPTMPIGRIWIVIAAGLTIVTWCCIRSYTKGRWQKERSAYQRAPRPIQPSVK